MWIANNWNDYEVLDATLGNLLHGMEKRVGRNDATEPMRRT